MTADWLTAAGTILVAVAAVGVALFAERRADERVKAEREHSATVLADERKAADARLLRQQEHSDEQLRRERQASWDAEQLAQAYAVQVVMGEMDAGPPAADGVYGDPVGEPNAKILAVMIVNRGSYTITRIEAQFSPDGLSLIPHHRFTRLAGFDDVPELLRVRFSRLRDDTGYGRILAPGDTGIRFETDPVGVNHLAGPHAVVSWTDRWDQRWEHKKGDIRKLD